MQFCSALLEQEFRALGLDMAAAKCEVVPTAGSNSTASQAMFPGWQWKQDGCFQLLGSPFGSVDFCNAQTAERGLKAEALLEELGNYDHKQGALLLLRYCASWGKLVYSARTAPPALHRAALTKFELALRRALEHLVGDLLPDRCWSLAQLSLVHGGLGIRSPARHAPAAHLASLSQTANLCNRIDPSFEAADASQGLQRAACEEELRAQVLEAVSWDRGGCVLSQKELSAMVDAAAKAALLEQESHDAAFRAHVALSCLPGAAVWLTAPPADDGRELDTPLFRVALKRRLRVPVYAADDFCPCCGQVRDKWGDHALTCSCNGERTIRHNALRDICFHEASECGQQPEREKAGLLPTRPEADGAPCRPLVNGRRPADVWLPRGASGGAEALDFAVTSGMRSDLFRASAEAPHLAFEQYDRFKRRYGQTEQLCTTAGFRFVPVVFEAHAGGWSPMARGLFDWLAREAAARHNEDAGSVSLRIAQRISVALHRENARAILFRDAEPEPQASPAGGWDGVFREGV